MPRVGKISKAQILVLGRMVREGLTISYKPYLGHHHWTKLPWVNLHSSTINSLLAHGYIQILERVDGLPLSAGQEDDETRYSITPEGTTAYYEKAR